MQVIYLGNIENTKFTNEMIEEIMNRYIISAHGEMMSFIDLEDKRYEFDVYCGERKRVLWVGKTYDRLVMRYYGIKNFYDTDHDEIIDIGQFISELEYFTRPLGQTKSANFFIQLRIWVHQY